MLLQWNEQIVRLVQRIDEGAQGKARPYIVAIDGRSGSGKSTLADTLAQRLRADVLSGDDFFSGGEEILDLPPQALAKICIDWRRQREILECLHLSEDVRFFPYDWDAFDGSTSSTPRVVKAHKVVIFEGVYSGRPELRDLVDLHVLLDVPGAVRSMRLENREGEIGEWELQWHRAEDWYFGSSATRRAFDLVMTETAASPK